MVTILFLKIDFGNELSSQEVALQVFLPQWVFTTVFGMGTGGFLTLDHQKADVGFSKSKNDLEISSYRFGTLKITQNYKFFNASS